MRGKILRIVFLSIIASLLVFTIASGLIANQLLSQRKVDRFTLGIWQKVGWFLRPTKMGGLIKSFPAIIGCDTPKYYFILLQNRYELRSSGGLMGSYARIKFENCRLAEIKVADIYEPDGQIPGHVEPPSPIQEAFQQGWYKLRDSNWEVDFKKSAQVIAWFFEKGNEAKPDGMIALNFDLILDLLRKVGPLYLPDFKQEITPDNFYEVVQVKVEEGFFPGSTQKRDFLTVLETAFTDKASKASLLKKVALARIVFDHLKRGEILLFSTNTETQKFIEGSGWSGKLEHTKSRGIVPVCSDYFYSVESNLGANKANRFIERTISFDVRKEGGQLIRQAMINLINNSPVNDADEDPLLFGGNYIDYHRVIIPIDSEGVEVSVGGEVLDTQKVTRRDFKESNLSEIGFWVTVLSERESGRVEGQEINVEYYTMEKPGWCLYRLDYQRQPGTGEYRVVVNSISKSLFSDNIDRDKVFNWWLR